MNRFAVFAGLIAVALWMTQASCDEGFLGRWMVDFVFMGDEITAQLDIKEGDDGELSGVWSGWLGETALDDVKIAGEGDARTLTFKRKLSGQGGLEAQLTYSANLREGALVGTIVSARGSVPFQGHRPSEDESAEFSDRQAAVLMLKALDRDGNGSLSEAEAPGQMKPFFAMMDANADGGIDGDEMVAIAQYIREMRELTSPSDQESDEASRSPEESDTM